MSSDYSILLALTEPTALPASSSAWKEQLEAFGPASFIVEPDLVLVWVSQQLKGLLDEDDDSKIGIGKPMIEAWMS